MYQIRNVTLSIHVKNWLYSLWFVKRDIIKWHVGKLKIKFVNFLIMNVLLLENLIIGRSVHNIKLHLLVQLKLVNGRIQNAL